MKLFYDFKSSAYKEHSQFSRTSQIEFTNNTKQYWTSRAALWDPRPGVNLLFLRITETSSNPVSSFTWTVFQFLSSYSLSVHSYRYSHFILRSSRHTHIYFPFVFQGFTFKIANISKQKISFLNDDDAFQKKIKIK